MVCKKLKRAAKNRTGFLKKTIVYMNFFSFNVGVGCVTNVTLYRTASADVRLFMHAADWLVGQQDPTSGGWPVQVTFNEKKAKYTKYARAKEIPAGWNSAMAQVSKIAFCIYPFMFTESDFKRKCQEMCNLQRSHLLNRSYV